MAQALLIAEKPSAARNMAKALGGMSGTYQGTDFEIVALRGHLYEYVEPAEQVDASLAEKYKSWDLNNLPWNPAEIQWKRKASTQSGIGEILRTLESKAKGAEEIVCAVDVDPSGEGGLLFAEPLIELSIVPRKLTRMYFTDETEASIQKAFVARKEIVGGLHNFDEYKKAVTRSKFDWLTQQFTRVATVSAAQQAVLRQGRLKSAMLLLVGEQKKAYEEYVKKPFFQNRFKDENGVVYTDPEQPQFPDAASVPQTFHASAVVVDSKTSKSTAPPRLLDLAGLSSRLSGKGVKADQVLAIVQKMYEDQVLSYPRTEDKTITTEQFNELLPLANKIAAVVGVDPAVLTHRAPRKTHVKDSGAHGANRPGPKVPASLDALTQKYGPVSKFIYEELARSFLAVLAEDYLYESQLGHVQDYPTFKGSAAVPMSLGWKQVFFEDKSGSSDDDEAENASGLGTKADPFVFEGANKRPEHPTMKWLMKQLEKRDVGTGATRTSTYAEVTKAQSAKNKYPLMSEQRGRITLTEFGEMGYRLLPGTRIGDLGMTEHVYQEMREVAAGAKTTEDVIGVVASWVTQDIQTMQRNAAAMRGELGLTQAVIQKEKAEGIWAVTREQVRFNREWSGYRFTDAEVAKLLAGEQINVTATSTKTGNPFTVHGKLGPGEFNGKPTFGFQLVGFGALDASGQELPPESWCSHKFTAAEMKKLAAGEKIFADNFVSKKGNTFAATVRFGTEDGKAGKRIIPEFGN
ncbi:DNA topoisomerase [Arthrobacter bambusae]|uniref:DNA topoisomerase-3 n=1 Tax=Arthrobacter bambusae TaxID=1338426 RepID=A0AAW8DCR2_9MICC|nr:DNA topoisomerase [Arthrobacter bambusae]MDP9903211.1 DNA topoisomerase-3 [Arthrobacter bambusae]MDQ0128795.1 DNA topoisomerase-3 [Arthrobacter bambusae]MDQ0180136.1 DNA topoisomerase-3 [Arthrobacter bambusae]